jgi:hypothetical protein
MNIRRLAPAAGLTELTGILAGLRSAPALQPFSPGICDLAARLSRALFTDPRTRRLPDLQALAFQLRPAAIKALEESFRVTAGRHLLQPRGLVFHLAPANVETMFVYSWLFAALMGNRNLVRISDRASDTSLLLCGIFDGVLADAPDSVSRSAAIVQYGHEDAITAAISEACDVRVVWGGDATVRAIRAVPLAPRATELVFADRYSLAIILASAYQRLTATERSALAGQFFNDTFWFDQAACSSPRLVIWYGDPKASALAAAAFFAELEAVVEKRGYAVDDGMRLERFTFGCRAALDGPVAELDRHHGNFETLTLRELTPFCREHCGGGLLYQFHTQTLETLAGFIDRRDQTLSYFGFEDEDLDTLAQTVSARGIDRIVPIGRALDFDRYWDGYDLFLEFSRHVTVGRVPRSGPSDTGGV